MNWWDEGKGSGEEGWFGSNYVELKGEREGIESIKDSRTSNTI